MDNHGRLKITNFIGLYQAAFSHLTDDEVIEEFGRPEHQLWSFGGYIPLLSTSTPNWCPLGYEATIAIANTIPTSTLRLHGARCLNTWNPTDPSWSFVAPYLGFPTSEALQSFCIYQGMAFQVLISHNLAYLFQLR